MTSPAESSSANVPSAPNYVQCLDDLNATRLAFQTVTYVFSEETLTTFVHFEPTQNTEEFGLAVEACFVRNNVSYTRDSLLRLFNIAAQKKPLLQEMLHLQIKGYLACKENDQIPAEDRQIFSCESIEHLAIQYAVMEKQMESLIMELSKHS